MTEATNSLPAYDQRNREYHSPEEIARWLLTSDAGKTAETLATLAGPPEIIQIDSPYDWVVAGEMVTITVRVRNCAYVDITPPGCPTSRFTDESDSAESTYELTFMAVKTGPIEVTGYNYLNTPVQAEVPQALRVVPIPSPRYVQTPHLSVQPLPAESLAELGDDLLPVADFAQNIDPAQSAQSSLTVSAAAQLFVREVVASSAELVDQLQQVAAAYPAMKPPELEEFQPLLQAGLATPPPVPLPWAPMPPPRPLPRPRA